MMALGGGPLGRLMRGISPQRWVVLMATVIALLLLVTGLSSGRVDAAATPTPEAASPTAIGPSRTLTLITGDQVIVTGDGQAGLTFLPDPTRRPHGAFTSTRNGRLHIVPNDMLGLVPRVLDWSLFDVQALAAQQDRLARLGRSGSLRVITAGNSNSTVGRQLSAASTAGNSTSLAGIDARAQTLTLAQARRVGASLVQAHRSVASAAASGPERMQQTLRQVAPSTMWLDRAVQLSPEQRSGQAAASFPAASGWDTNLTQMGAPQAWQAKLTGKGTTIAVLDTGVDPNHPDLKGKVADSQTFAMMSADSGDHMGHGTHVAALAAGAGKVAPTQRRGVAYEAKILNGKVLDDNGGGFESDIMAGMQWAAQTKKASVVSMSLGGFVMFENDPMSVMVDRLTASTGSLFVVAAGNAGQGTVGSPGMADQALTVGAVDARGALAPFSSYGRQYGPGIKPEITAPGVDIISACTTTMQPEPCQGPFLSMSGTSMATPQVAGAAALVRQAHPSWTPAQVKAALVGTAVTNPDESVRMQGGGLVNIPAAAADVVVPLTSTVDAGSYSLNRQTPPVTRTLTWANTSTTAVNLALSLDNDPATPRALASVTPSMITVPAGGRANATLTVRPGALSGPGYYGGEVVATPVQANAAVDRPDGIAFQVQVKPRSHTVTMKFLDESGLPASMVAPQMLDLANYQRGYQVPIGTQVEPDGVVRLTDVPEGTYWLSSVWATMSAGLDPLRYHWRVLPQLDVTSDVSVVFDGKASTPIRVSAEGKLTQSALTTLVIKGRDEAGQSFHQGLFAVTDFEQVAVQPFDKPSQARVETMLTSRLQTPPLRFTTPGQERINAYQMIDSPSLTGKKTLPVKDVGTGTAQRFADAHVAGAIAVVHRSPMPAQMAYINAVQEGAAMVLFANDSNQSWAVPVSPEDNSDRRPAAFTVTAAEAALLLASKQATLQFNPTQSPSYNTVWITKDGFPSPRLVVDQARQQRMSRTLHSLGLVPGVSRYDFASAGVAAVVPGYERFTLLISAQSREGTQWWEYSDPGTWAHLANVYPQEGGQYITVSVDSTKAGQVGQQRWMSGLWQQPASYNHWEPRLDGQPPRVATRSGNTLYLNVPVFADGGGHPVLNGFVQANDNPDQPITTVYTVRKDGKQVGSAQTPAAVVPVPQGPGAFQLRYQVGLPTNGYRADTTWSFPSASEDPNRQVPLPLLEAQWKLPVSLRNELIGSTGSLTLSNPYGPQQDVTGLTVDLSRDGGKSWVAVPVTMTGKRSASLALPKLAATTALTVRVNASTTGGLAIQQVLTSPVRVR